MVRLASSTVLGFLLMIVQSLLVMKINHYTSIQFAKPQYMLIVWAIDFCFAFAILTQIGAWIEKNRLIDSETAKK